MKQAILVCRRRVKSPKRKGPWLARNSRYRPVEDRC